MVGEQGTSRIFHMTVWKIVIDELKGTQQADGKHSYVYCTDDTMHRTICMGEGEDEQTTRTKRAHRSIKPMETMLGERKKHRKHDYQFNVNKYKKPVPNLIRLAPSTNHLRGAIYRM